MLLDASRLGRLRHVKLFGLATDRFLGGRILCGVLRNQNDDLIPGLFPWERTCCCVGLRKWWVEGVQALRGKMDVPTRTQEVPHFPYRKRSIKVNHSTHSNGTIWVMRAAMVFALSLWFCLFTLGARVCVACAVNSELQRGLWKLQKVSTWKTVCKCRWNAFSWIPSTKNTRCTRYEAREFRKNV
jgi:hypothetical protein